MLFVSMGMACAAPAANGGNGTVKTQGVFCTAAMLEKARTNATLRSSEPTSLRSTSVGRYPWAAEMAKSDLSDRHGGPKGLAIQKQIIANAEPWMKFSDEELWNLMFGNTITRSWMVWSNGYCPACKQGVPMYTWEIDALGRPWKVRCPHCKELFPKNDFYQFYLSGLDEHGVFDPKRADRKLLAPDDSQAGVPALHDDPLHAFGVDDGEGYVEGGNATLRSSGSRLRSRTCFGGAGSLRSASRWRFIGAYLIYGQWKQAVVGGVHNLAAAYVVTGDPVYAHKAGVLLDRVADLYPTFDFGKEGMVYEVQGAAGYVSTWHDACAETRDLVLSYDQVFDALQRDAELVVFLGGQAKRYNLDNPKASWADIERNIEDRILRDAVQSRRKIESNYPQTDITIAMIHTVLGWPQNREKVYETLDAILDKATAVDGVTGEKGLAGYAAYAVAGTALLLEQYARMDSTFLPQMFQRHPRLRDMFRFHIDTHCLERYYPTCGDSGAFAHPTEQYAGVYFSKSPGLAPSMYTFLWRMCQLTGDPAFAQVLYRANGETVEGLPYDLFADAPAELQKGVGDIIVREGAASKVGSVNKQQWRLGILRSGRGADARALWLDYDSGGGHSHADGMNLGLFAKGLDLLPDFGYPPVNYGGWGAPRAVWYTMTAAHNTVCVDGENLHPAAGQTTLWADGESPTRQSRDSATAASGGRYGDGARFRAIRASCPELIGGKQFERTAAMIDISDRDFYVVDVFRVIGGADHAKLTYSHFGQISTEGLSLQPGADYGHGTQTRNFMADAAPAPGWSADWTIEDRRHLLPVARRPRAAAIPAGLARLGTGAQVHLRCTDLTVGAQALTGEAWIAMGGYSANDEAWIPLVMVRRQGQAPLASTFVTLIEPYDEASNISGIRRLPLETTKGERFPDPNVAVEVALADGRRDLIVAADVENPLGMIPSRAQHRVLVQREWGLRLDGELAVVRWDQSAKVQRIVLCKGSSLSVGDIVLKLKSDTDFIEVAFSRGRALVISGNREAVQAITIAGKDIWRR